MPGLYIATDQDQDYDPAYDPTTATGEEGEEQEEDYYEEYYEEEEEEEEPAPLKLVSDVSDEAYWDDTALTNCWLAAVSDFKVSSSSLPATRRRSVGSYSHLVTPYSTRILLTLLPFNKHLVQLNKSILSLHCAASRSLPFALTLSPPRGLTPLSFAQLVRT